MFHVRPEITQYKYAFPSGSMANKIIKTGLWVLDVVVVVVVGWWAGQQTGLLGLTEVYSIESTQRKHVGIAVQSTV